MTMLGTKETTEIVYETYCDEPDSPKPSKQSSGSKDYEISDIIPRHDHRNLY